ncbi:monocarboxylate transporter 4-like [Petromyzon marinus]|uniref:monocarboxylate transporter 4-like n=1 Tax=Petromyzon marinus TaxID=7757 RepID=UPI003F6EB780
MGGAVVDDCPQLVPPPDGGWAWLVLLGCFVVTGFSYAFPKAVSVFFKELIHDFGVGYSDTAWLSSILLAMLYGTGPLCSVLVSRFGCRPVMIGGGLLAAAGMVGASFSTSIIHVYLLAGVTTGMGLALNFQPSLIMLGRYFSKRRPLANGLAAAGSPVFLCTLSPLNQLLQHHFGWRGGFMVLGGLLLNCCLCGALMRPLVPPPGQAQKLMGANATTTTTTSTTTTTTAPPPAPPPPRRRHRPLIDLSVIRHRGFVVYAVSATLMVLGLFVPPVFVVSYARHLGTPDPKAAFLLSVIGLVDVFARPATGLVTGVERVRPYSAYLLSFAMIFNGTADLLGSLASTYAGIAVFCVFFGISYGMVGALQFEVLMGLTGPETFPSALGLVLLMEAGAVLVGPPGAGRLVDYTHSYVYIFYLAGAEVLLAGLVLALGALLCLRGNHNHQHDHAHQHVGGAAAAVGGATAGATNGQGDTETRV